MTVGIINYGAGNIASLANILRYIGVNPLIVNVPEDIAKVDRLILPGVGAAPLALKNLRANSLDQALFESVRVKGMPLLGVCLGMQLLAERLYEFGESRGLGWIEGEVVSLDSILSKNTVVPHIGWNKVLSASNNTTFNRMGIMDRSYYFAHSYTLQIKMPSILLATVEYEKPIVAAIAFETVIAVQFHPEKSQTSGEKLLEYFVNWTP